MQDPELRSTSGGFQFDGGTSGGHLDRQLSRSWDREPTGQTRSFFGDLPLRGSFFLGVRKGDQMRSHCGPRSAIVGFQGEVPGSIAGSKRRWACASSVDIRHKLDHDSRSSLAVDFHQPGDRSEDNTARATGQSKKQTGQCEECEFLTTVRKQHIDSPGVRETDRRKRRSDACLRSSAAPDHRTAGRAGPESSGGACCSGNAPSRRRSRHLLHRCDHSRSSSDADPGRCTTGRH